MFSFIRWFHFEKVVEALVANKIYHMELKELLKYTKRFCHIDKEDELKAMLKFYHDLGVIVKHGRTVVLQALWLIDLFKQLINVRPYDERVNSDTPHTPLFYIRSLIVATQQKTDKFICTWTVWYLSIRGKKNLAIGY